MGLMLSILVTCVGVIELITFYQNISRHLRYPPQRGDLSVISDRYVRELGEIPRRPKEDFLRYTKAVPPTLRLNSHEDIEIKYSRDLQHSRSPSPRRFLVTETEDSVNQHERSCSPRKFLVSEEPGVLKKTKSQNSIPEFLIEEEKNSEKCPHKPRYLLKEKQNEESPIPLPRQFIVSEEILNTVVFDDTDFEVPETSEIPLEHEASPFLLVDPPAVPRNSICAELIEGEGEPIKSFDPIRGEKVDVILESTNFNTTQYWTNKVLVVPSRTSRSGSVSPVNDFGPVDGQDVIKYDEKYLNDLDGVSKAKSIKRFGTSRRSVKKKDADQNASGISQTAPEDKTTEVLKHAAEELQKVTSEENSQKNNHPSTSKSIDPTTGKPFWLIFSGEYTKAMNKDWHGQHFCCWQCDESLTGQRYVLRDEHPYCVSCYESVFANACEKCSRIIGIDSKDLSYKDKHWHEACFLCTTCGESLVDKQFGSKGDRIYCGNCYDQQFASRCDGCHEIFRAGKSTVPYLYNFRK